MQVDKASDSAFIPVGVPGNTSEIIGVPPNPKIAGQVNLHVDDQGHVTGVELLSARTILPESAWNQADSARRR